MLGVLSVLMVVLVAGSSAQMRMENWQPGYSLIIPGVNGGKGQWYAPSVGAMEKKDNYGSMSKTYYPAAVACAGRLFVSGGIQGDTFFEDVIEYDPVTEESMAFANLTMARSDHSMDCLDNFMLYVCGGRNGKKASDVKMTTSCEVCSLREGKCFEISPMPKATRFHASATYMNHLFIVGGGDALHKDTSNAVFVHDALTHGWARMANMSTARGNYPGAIAVHDHLIVCGGNDGKNTLKTCEKYDFMAGKWMPMASMNKARNDVKLVMIGHWLHAVGGQTTVNGVVKAYDCLEWYDHENDKWTEGQTKLKQGTPNAFVATMI